MQDMAQHTNSELCELLSYVGFVLPSPLQNSESQANDTILRASFSQVSSDHISRAMASYNQASKLIFKARICGLTASFLAKHVQAEEHGISRY